MPTTETPIIKPYAAVFTPTQSDNREIINPELIPVQLATLESSGCAGIFLSGTNGLGLATSLADRKKLMEEYLTHSNNLDIIAHIGASAEGDMKELASHAAKTGITKVAITFANQYYKPQTVREATDLLQRIAQHVPETDIYLYHFPNLTGGEDMDMPELIRTASNEISNFAGLKLTSPGISKRILLACKEAADQCGKVIGFGVDEEFDKAVACGYETFIGSTFNLQTPLFLERFKLHHENPKNDLLLKQYQEISMALISLLYSHETAGLNAFLPRAHYAMRTLGGIEQDFGSPQPPIRMLDSGEAKALEKDLAESTALPWSNASALK